MRERGRIMKKDQRKRTTGNRDKEQVQNKNGKIKGKCNHVEEKGIST